MMRPACVRVKVKVIFTSNQKHPDYPNIHKESYSSLSNKVSTGTLQKACV